LQEKHSQDDDAETESCLKEAQKQEEVYHRLLLNSGVAMEGLRDPAKLDVVVKDTFAEGADSVNNAGVSKEAIDRVSKARVQTGKLTAKAGGKNQIGVW
jgi:hypothetical protein